MFNLISIIIGLVGIILAFVAFFPFIGWLNWIAVPIGILGLIFGLLSNNRTGRNLNIAVIALGVIRLMLGGGIF